MGGWRPGETRDGVKDCVGIGVWGRLGIGALSLTQHKVGRDVIRAQAPLLTEAVRMGRGRVACGP
eukprot:scaffold62203_cov35-Phaeocystis_antarctica.AAC.4